MCGSGSGGDEEDWTKSCENEEEFYFFYLIISSSIGGIVLLILFCSCITFVLLCKIMRTLRGIINIQYSKDSIENGTETAAAEPDEDPPAETKSPNADDKPPPEVDSAAVEAMYSVVSKEHCEKKRKANLQIQPYDDVVLSIEVGTKPQDHANEGVESQLQNANPEDTGYSRLCHPGPRMSQTKKPEHLSYELLKQDARKGSLSAANLKNGSYSEVQPSPRPSSQVIVPANYTLIDDKEVLPPPLPSRLSVTIPLPSIPLPQKMQNSSPENTENIPKTNAYETIDATPSVTDEEFLMQGLCMTEFHSTQAEKNTVTKGDYDVLKSP